MLWLATLPLRLKVWGLGLAAALLVLGGAYARYRVVKADKVRAEQRAAALEAARRLQLRVITKRTELQQRQRTAREMLAARTQRDLFEDQGWGP